MRDITRLELAAFERLQRANWPPHMQMPSDEEIDARLDPVWAVLMASAENETLTLDPEPIAELNRSVGTALGVEQVADFHNPGPWRDYVRHLHSTGARNVRDTAARLIMRLHWHHLQTFGLITAWLHISALGVQQGTGPLQLQPAGTARLMRSLSAAGPPNRDSRTLHATLFPDED